MSETYKGLTVRIGGDVAPLERSLRYLNTPIRETQSKLRQMSKALKLDPTSTGVLERNLKNLSDRAVELGMKIRDVNEATAGFKKSHHIEDVAEFTKDAALNAALAKQNYDDLNAQLARMYTTIQNESGIDLHLFNDTPEELRSALDDLVELGDVSKETARDFLKLHDSWVNVRMELEKTEQIKGFDKLLNEAQLLDVELKKVLTDIVDNERALNKTDITIDEDLERAEAAGKVLEERLKKIDAAGRLHPDSIELITAKSVILQEQVDVTKEKIQILDNTIKRLDSQGIGKLAQDSNRTALSAEKLAKKYRDAQARVANLAKELKNAKRDQKKLNASAGVSSEEYDKAEREVKSLKKQLKQAEEQAKELKKALNVEDNINTYRDLKAQLAQLEAELGNLEESSKNAGASFAGAASKAESAAGKMARAEDEMAVKARQSRKAWREFGFALSATVTPTIVAMGRGVVSSSNDIDSAFRDMSKTVSATDRELENLRSDAITFATTHFTSADQLLEIEAIGGQLGISSESLSSFAETIANLDIATNIDAETAAIQVGQLRGILDDLTDDTIPRYGDALVRLGNNTPALESDIVDISSRIGSMASILGMSTPDILAFSTAIAATGQGAEAAGTAMSKTMSDIESAVGSGGEALEAFSSISGMTADEFASTWNSNPTEALLKFIEGLKAIDEDGGSVDATLKNLGITSVRQKQGLEGLTQTVDILRNSLQMSNDAWNGMGDQWGNAGDAAREAGRKAEGFSGQLQILKNIAKGAAAEIGDGMVPYMTLLADVAGGASEWFSSLSDNSKTFIVGLAGFAAATGPAITAFNSMRESAGELKGHLLGIKDKALQAIPALGKLGTSTGMLTAAAATLAITIGAMLLNELKKQKEHEEKLLNVQGNMSKSLDLLNGNYEATTDKISDFNDAVIGSAKDLKASSEEMLDSVIDYREQIAESFQDVQEKGTDLEVVLGIMEGFADKTHLSATEQVQLQEAVKKYNEITGDSVEVTNAATGELSKNVDELRESADAWRENAEMQALANARQTAMTEQATALNELQSAQFRYNETFQKYLDAVEAGDPIANTYWLELQDLSEAIENNSAAYQGATEDVGLFALETAKAAGTINESLLPIVEDMPVEVMDAGVRAAEGLTSAIEAGTISADEASAILVSVVEGALGGLPPTAQALGSQTIDNLTAAIASGKLRGEQAIGEVTGAINAYLSKVPAEMLPYATEVVNSLTSEIANGSLSASDATAVLNAAIEGKVEELPDDLKPYGEKVVNGLSKGIEDAGPYIDDAVDTIHDKVVDGVPGWDEGHDRGSSFARGYNAGIKGIRVPTTGGIFADRRHRRPGRERRSLPTPPSSGERGISLASDTLEDDIYKPMFLDSYDINADNYSPDYVNGVVASTYTVPTPAEPIDNTSYVVEEAAKMILRELPGIIEEHTPVMSSRDFGRAVRKYV